MTKQNIVPFFWHDNTAEAAANLYVSLFDDARITALSRSGPDNAVLVANIELAGLRIGMLNGGPVFRPNPTISLFVSVPNVAMVDRIWNGLLDGAKVLMPLDAWPWSKRYGWLEDRFGTSWQIILNEDLTSAEIKPQLMFADALAGQAEKAMEDYVRIFANSGIDFIDRDPDQPGALIRHGRFHLGPDRFLAMDSPYPHGFTFSEGTSLMVNCASQTEVDHYWDELTAHGGSESRCGWLKDRYGVSWQIIPNRLMELMSGPDRAAAQRVMQAMLAMKKIVIAELEAAAKG